MPVVNDVPGGHVQMEEGAGLSWDNLDCQKMLGTWLGELEELTGKLGLEEHGGSNTPQMRERTQQPRIDTYRFSQANLEDSLDVDLDEILGELCALGTQFDQAITDPRTQDGDGKPQLTRKLSGGQKSDYIESHKRTDSPDNDSAFSDSVSMLSSESSASSGASGARTDCSKSSGISSINSTTQMDHAARIKAEKIKLALEKIKEANIQKLFIKAFTPDGSAKSLLVDENMTVAFVTRILADKNHVSMDPKWAIVEYLPDLYMERIYEDHELLVHNMLLWANNSCNKIYFSERLDKYDLFAAPEQYLLPGSSSEKGHDLTDEEKHTLLEEFFSSTGVGVPEIEGSLFLKADGKKAWKRHQFVLRASGLYYCPKGKSSRSSKDLVCLAPTEVNQVYYGVGWKKKFKAPTEHCFAIKHPSIQTKSASKYIKYLCAEDEKSLRLWVMGIRIAKHGRHLLENYKNLLDDLAQEDIDRLAHARSFSVVSMASSGRTASTATTPSDCSKSLELCLSPERDSSSSGSTQATPVNTLDRAKIRRPMSRQDSIRSKSSSSSSGCLSERSGSGTPTWEHGFDSDFPMGTIKRKPSLTPKIPLTNTTRLLVKEVEDVVDGDITESGDLIQRNSLRQSTRKSLSEEIHTLRRKSQRCAEIVKDSLPLPPPPEFGDNFSDADSLPPPPSDLMSNSTLSIDSLPPPPPPIFSDQDSGSTLSLNSLPPPPSPLLQPREPSPPPAPKDLVARTSLPPLPDPDIVTKLQPSSIYGNSKVLVKPLRRASEDTSLYSSSRASEERSSIYSRSNSGESIYGSSVYSRSNSGESIYSSSNPPPFLSELKAHASSPKLLRRTGSCLSGSSSQTSSSTDIANNKSPMPKSPTKKGRKISFDDSVPPLAPPRKPSPPKRSDSTRLSHQSTSPKKLSSPGSTVTPPQDFLQHLQKVMQRKCSVAQRLKLEPDSTAHEVLGFRDHNVNNDLYENQKAVGAWIQEHYGGDTTYDSTSPLYDTARYPVYEGSGGEAVIDKQLIYARRNSEGKRRPPPPPPKRSESTQLSSRMH